ncbi:MAG: IS21 family transposase, partial [Acidobacteriota bacterium]|nr:IS21 family transposase [Acidobacteriota bacterium]
MRKIKETLRMNALGLSARRIGRSLGIAKSTVNEYVKRAAAAGLTWPWPEEWDETTIERRLFPAGPRPDTVRPLPDWSETHMELRKKGLTLFLLWEEYK